MELTNLIVLFFAVIFSSRTDAVTFSTTIYPEPDYGDIAVIILPEEENATVTFRCDSFQNDALRETFWFIRPYGASGMESILLFPQFVRSANPFSNLTIVNVTSDLDRAQVLCGPATDQLDLRFLLGFEVAAQLDSAGVISVREGEDFSVSLEAESNSPFSPLVTFQWMYNGEMLNSSQRILLNVYNITIAGVQRQDAGEYLLNVTNSAGSVTGNFTLDVLFGPDAMNVSVSPLYFIAGINITLTAFTNVEGNPEPISTWTLDSNAIPTNDTRFNTMVRGQLSITNVSSADEGTYTCTLSNGDTAFDKSATIELVQADLPTMPENVTANEVNATSATLMWDAPSFQGIFVIRFYRVRLVPSPSDEVIETNMTQTFVSGLLPGNEYSVTVVAVFTDPLAQKELEVESSSVFFNTSVTAPLFEQVNVVSEGGFIRVYWTLLYTGGLDTTVESVCNVDDGASGSGYDPMYVLSDTEIIVRNSETLVGDMSLGPVLAGATYSCVITAYNSIGKDVEEWPDLMVDIGIPSAPVIMDTMMLPGMVVLTVKTTSPGGPVVYFSVTYRADGSAEVKTMNFTITDYNPDEGAVLTLNLPAGGSFSISVISFNSFGSLGVADYVNVTDVPRAPSTSTPGIVTSTPSQPPTATSTGEPATTDTPAEPVAGGLSGGEVAGIVIAILIIAALLFLIVLVVIYLYIRNRGESYQVDKQQSKNSVKMSEVEVDIGTEIDSRPPEEPEKPKGTEVQYADLDHFRKKEQTPDDTTPLAPSPAANPALEPVMYSVIQPQPVKSENGSQPSAADGSDATSI